MPCLHQLYSDCVYLSAYPEELVCNHILLVFCLFLNFIYVFCFLFFYILPQKTQEGEAKIQLNKWKKEYNRVHVA